MSYGSPLLLLVVLTAILMSSLSLQHTCKAIPSSSISYLDATTARVIDEVLMQSPGFSIDQLMELAGLAVATAVMDSLPWETLPSKDILILCGPGNNGGDGLVAARHLKHFGLVPSIIYPKHNQDSLFINLVQQCRDLHVQFLDTPSEGFQGFSIVIDALFGFSFKGPTREPFTQFITHLATSQVPVLSVDIPSGWDVEQGDVFNTGFLPAAVISLTLPKLAMKNYNGIHYIGGRFVPPHVVSQFNLQLPDYGFGSSQVSQ